MHQKNNNGQSSNQAALTSMTKTNGRRFNTMSYIDDIYTVENHGEAGTCYSGYDRETAVRNAQGRLHDGGYYQDQAGRWCPPD